MIETNRFKKNPMKFTVKFQVPGNFKVHFPLLYPSERHLVVSYENKSLPTIKSLYRRYDFSVVTVATQQNLSHFSSSLRSKTSLLPNQENFLPRFSTTPQSFAAFLAHLSLENTQH